VTAPWAADPVHLGFAEVRAIRFAGAGPEGAPEPGVIDASGVRLHGHVAPGGEPGVLRWWPASGAATTSLDLDEKGRIQFSGRRGRSLPPQDQVYLRNRDVLSAHVLTVADDVLTVEMDGVERTLGADAWKAIRFFSPELALVSGLDAEWTREGQVAPAPMDGAVTLSGDGDLVLRRDLPRRLHLSFDAEFQGPGRLTVGIAGREQRPVRRQDCMSVEFLPQGDGFTAAVEQSNGQNQGEGFVFVEEDDPRKKGGEAGPGTPVGHFDVFLDLDTRHCEAYANGRLVVSQRLDRAEWEPGAVFLSIKSLGNLMHFVRNARTTSLEPAEPDPKPVRVMNLRVLRGPRGLDDERRARLLTRRRGATEAAQSAILRAPGGDLVRGRLEHLDADGIVFKSGLETLRLLPEQVAELIRLVPMQPRGPTDGTVTLALFGGGLLTLKPLAADADVFRGVSDELGECAVPWDRVLALYLGEGHQRPDNPYEAWVLGPPIAMPEEDDGGTGG